MTRIALALALTGLALGPFACGDPEVKQPAPLEVVYLPLDGAIDVEFDVAIKVFFSGDVDATSVTTGSVVLEQATYDAGAESCGDWTASGLVPAVTDGDPRVVRLGSDADLLAASSCYRLTCTTDVQGVELGPLADLGIDGRKGVAVDATFRTRP